MAPVGAHRIDLGESVPVALERNPVGPGQRRSGAGDRVGERLDLTAGDAHRLSGVVDQDAVGGQILDHECVVADRDAAEIGLPIDRQLLGQRSGGPGIEGHDVAVAVQAEAQGRSGHPDKPHVGCFIRRLLIVAAAGGDQEGEQQYLARAHVTSAGSLLGRDVDP